MNVCRTFLRMKVVPNGNNDIFSYQANTLIEICSSAGGNSSKEPACQCRRYKRRQFDPWVRKLLWRSAQQPTPVFLPGESHGERSLVGYRPVIKSWTQLKWLSTVHTLGRAWTSDHRICQAETLFPLDLDHMLSKLLSHLELPLTSSIMPPSSFCVGEQFLIAPFFTSFQLFIQQVLWTLSHSINTIIPACQELCKCFFIGLPASILS